MAHDVFISCAHPDKPVGDAICATLEQNNIRCWIAPRDIMPGANWGEAIISGINGAKLMVLVFSSKANASQHIKREVERAVNAGLPIIPVRIEDVLPDGALEYFLSTPHWLDAFTPPMHQHLERLVQVSRCVLDAGRPTPGVLHQYEPAEGKRSEDWSFAQANRLGRIVSTAPDMGVLRARVSKLRIGTQLWTARLFSLKGRASRRQWYLRFLIALFGALVAALLMDKFLSWLYPVDEYFHLSNSRFDGADLLTAVVVFYGLLLPVSVRRMHDTARRGSFALAIFLPAAAFLTCNWWIVLASSAGFLLVAVLPSRDGASLYGPNPRRKH